MENFLENFGLVILIKIKEKIKKAGFNIAKVRFLRTFAGEGCLLKNICISFSEKAGYFLKVLTRRKILW